MSKHNVVKSEVSIPVMKEKSSASSVNTFSSNNDRAFSKDSAFNMNDEFARMNARMRDFRRSFEDLAIDPTYNPENTLKSTSQYEHSSSKTASDDGRSNNTIQKHYQKSASSYRSNSPSSTRSHPAKLDYSRKSLGGPNHDMTSPFDDHRLGSRSFFDRKFDDFYDSFDNRSLRSTKNMDMPIIEKKFEDSLIHTDANGKKKFQVTLDARDFSIQDIKVKVLENMLKIHAKKESRSPSGASSYKEFNKEFTIPPGVNIDILSSKLMQNGELIIEAPLFPDVKNNSTLSRSSNLGERRNLVDSDRSCSRVVGNEFAEPNFLSNRVSRNHPRNDLRGDYDSRSNPVENFKSPFKLTFSMKEYRPEEIKISVSNNLLKIHAKHEEKSAGKSMLCEFNREFTIPSDINPDTIKSTLTESGVLIVESVSGYNACMPTRSENQVLQSHAPPSMPNYSGTLKRSAMNRYPSSERLIEDDANISKRFLLKFDMKGYPAEKIKVKVLADTLRVEAKHEEDVDGKYVLREFSKEYLIPKSVNPNELRSSLSSDGFLTIEAPTLFSRVDIRQY